MKAAITLASLCLIAIPQSTRAESAAARLPDLGIAPLEHLLVQTTSDGKRLLRFSTSIANVGAGPMEIVASRPERGTDFSVSQRIRRADGSTSLVATPGVGMVFAGGAHGHWHAQGAVRYELRRLGELTTVKVRLKRGFCFYDSSPDRLSLAGAPKREVYPRGGAATNRRSRSSQTSRSDGSISATGEFRGQELDVTTLPNGKYRLSAKVDPKNWFRETNERNNVTWVDIEIGARLVRVIGRSPRF